MWEVGALGLWIAVEEAWLAGFLMSVLSTRWRVSSKYGVKRGKGRELHLR